MTDAWRVAAGPGGGGLGPVSRSLTESLMVPVKGPEGESRHAVFGARTKVQNKNKKKVSKMTTKEMETVRKTTRDIRAFFEGKQHQPTTTKEEKIIQQSASQPNIQTKVSPKLNSSKIVVLSCPDEPGGAKTVVPEAGRSGDGPRLGVSVSRRLGVPVVCDVGGGVDDKNCVEEGGAVSNCVVDEKPEMKPETTCLARGVAEEDAADPDPDPDGGGGQDCGGGQGDGDITSSSQRKTKPKDGGGGGLRKRILLWEMKIIGDEKCTDSNTAGELRRNFGDRQDTE